MIGPMRKVIGKSSLTASILAVFWLVSAMAATAATVTAFVIPEKVAPNQQFQFVIQIDDATQAAYDERLQLPLQILQLSAPVRTTLPAGPGGQKSQTTLVWVVVAREPGVLVIPPQTLRVNGAEASTNEVRLNVESSQAAPADPSMGFILQLELPKNEIYQGEVVPLFAKLYIPREAQFNSSPRLIEIEKSDFAVARFPQQADQSMVDLDGVGYHVLTYRTTLSSLRPGEFKLGPATQTIVAELPTMGSQNPSMFGGPTEPRNLSIKSQILPVKILPLPTEGKPESFNGAVGDFSMTATASPTELTVGDPLAVEIIIAGTGNFDALIEPVFTVPQGWKAYPAKRYSIEGQLDQNQVPTLERKIGYSQVFIPEAVHSQLPPFEMSFFSLQEKKYVTLRTEAIPLNMKPAPPLPGGGNATAGSQTGKEVPPPGIDPQAAITDIVINPPATSQWLKPEGEPLLHNRTFWSVQVIPVGILFLVSILALLRRQREARQAGRAGELRAAWVTFERNAKKESDFLRAAAQFIHSAKEGDPVVEPELQMILDRYQTSNFTADKTSTSVSSNDRRKMTSELSRLMNRTLAKVTAVVVLLLACVELNAQSVKAASTNPDEIYREAVTELEQRNYTRAQYLAESLTKKEPPVLSSEVFQIIGHARYRQEDVGRAALWYQRAQLLDMRSPELKQNVRHLFEKERYLSFSEGSALRQWSLWLPQNQWLIIAAVGGWLILLSLAWWLFSRGQRGGLVITLVLIGFSLAVPAGTLAVLRPSGAERVKDISVVVAPNTTAYTAATVTAGIVIDLPMGSQIRVLEKRGRWAYVEIPSLPDNLLGWVEEAALAPLWIWDENLVP